MVFWRNNVKAGCGHQTQMVGKVVVSGKSFKVKLKKEPELCLDCVQEKSIRCAASGKLIKAEKTPVYLECDPALKAMIPYAEIYEDKVVCLFQGFTHQRPLEDGYWTNEGFEPINPK